MHFHRPELDALRLFAFGCVFVDHLPVVAPWFDPIREMGAFGMPVFFVLSAYLIVTLLLREKEITKTVDLKAFAMRRILRIWPLYFLVIGICYAIGRIFLNARVPGHAVAAFTLLAGNWYILKHGWMPSPINPLWSISVEEQFYVAIPFASKVGDKRTLAIIFAATIAMSYGALLWHGRATPTPQIWVNSFVQFQFFGAGGLIALFYFQRPVFPAKTVRAVLAASGVLLWICAEQCSITLLTPQRASRLMAGYLCVLLGTVAIFAATLGQKAEVPKAIVYLGKISYGLYAFHQLFFWTVFSGSVPVVRRLASHNVLAIAFVLSATIGAAALSYKFFESPILMLKKHFDPARRPI